MSTAPSIAANEAQIRHIVESWSAAVRARDVDRVMSHYAGDVVFFDLAPPLQLVGTAGYRRSLEEWFRSFSGPIGHEVHDLRVTAGEDVAFTTSVNRVTGARTNGERTDVWVRATVGYRKRDGAWKVSHEHVSVPFYMDGSDRAALDLSP
jgi:uncharacterized protein (TIGR02246 family)